MPTSRSNAWTSTTAPQCSSRPASAVERIGGGAGERLAELAIEIGSAADERVIDGVLGELEARHVVAEERLDVAALEVAAQVRARAIEHAGQREADPIVGGALRDRRRRRRRARVGQRARGGLGELARAR